MMYKVSYVDEEGKNNYQINENLVNDNIIVVLNSFNHLDFTLEINRLIYSIYDLFEYMDKNISEFYIFNKVISRIGLKNSVHEIMNLTKYINK